MGSDIRCSASLGDRTSEGRALLETDEVVFRGDFKARIPFRDMRSVEATDGVLRIAFDEGVLALELGPQAATWARKIANPPSRLDKLGIKPGQRVSVLGVGDAAFAGELLERDVEVIDGRPAPDSDAIVLGAETRDALARLVELQDYLKRDGAIWVIRPRGAKDITESDVMSAGKAAGLADTKVARFSDTHTAEKLVIPKHRR